MDIDKYRDIVRNLRDYPISSEGDYLTAELVASLGNLFSNMSKYHKGTLSHKEFDKVTFDQLGDIMCTLVRYCDYSGLNPSDVLAGNIKQLKLKN